MIDDDAEYQKTKRTESRGCHLFYLSQLRHFICFHQHQKMAESADTIALQVINQFETRIQLISVQILVSLKLIHFLRNMLIFQ